MSHFRVADIKPGKRAYHQDEFYWVLDQPDPLALVRSMLAHGFDPSCHFGYAGTPLSVAVSWTDHAVTRLLLEQGANPNHVVGIEAKPALWFAAESGDVALMELLVSYGAQVKGSNALHEAAAYLRLDIVRFLLANGADVNELSRDSRYVPGEGRREMWWGALHECVDARGASDEVPSNEGGEGPEGGEESKEEVVIVGGERHLAVLRVLLENGADVHLENERGMSALGLAEEKGVKSVVELLREWGDAHPKDKEK